MAPSWRLLFCVPVVCLISGFAAEPVDLALSKYRDCWLHHPIIGDPSWDSFTREPGNPIYTGKAPFTWPVNGFLFRDPPSGRWYVYVGLYPKGYWPPPAAQTLLMREKAGGGWEDLGVVLAGDPKKFDGDGKMPGAMPDVSVVFDAGRYHMIYDWCDPQNKNGGLGYAWADKPEGPFHRAETPIHEEFRQKPLLGRYVRAYAGTLIRREKDWLILFMMSTPGNAGGVWAMAGMTAAKPEGPYSEPVLLLYPQSEIYHPPLAEFYPAFAHDGFVYAPASSVAANRSFQTVFRAKESEAHKPEAWSVIHNGSAWHAVKEPSEAQGIWGQTFSGQVAPDGVLRVMYPSKNGADVGTIHMARRKLDRPFKDGFVLSAPNAPACAILHGVYSDFKVKLKVRASGTWAFGFGCSSPLGSDRHTADAAIQPLMRTRRHEWRQNGAAWSVANDGGDLKTGTLVFEPSKAATIEIECVNSRCRIVYNGVELWNEALKVAPGRLELYAEKHANVEVDEFLVDGAPATGWESFLASDALAGAGAGGGEWKSAAGAHYRFGIGFENVQPQARAKWNYAGRGFRFWAPKGPGYGTCEITVDGQRVGTVDCHAANAEASAMILEKPLAMGFHAVVVRALTGITPLDSLEVDVGDGR